MLYVSMRSSEAEPPQSSMGCLPRKGLPLRSLPRRASPNAGRPCYAVARLRLRKLLSVRSRSCSDFDAPPRRVQAPDPRGRGPQTSLAIARSSLMLRETSISLHIYTADRGTETCSMAPPIVHATGFAANEPNLLVRHESLPP